MRANNPHTEYILCSAIWYRELPLVDPEVLDNTRPYNIDTGVVFCGWRHFNCMYAMCAITGKRSIPEEVGAFTQGFLTSKNRFVDRIEAMQIAKEQGQILNENDLTGNQLYSEDVW